MTKNNKPTSIHDDVQLPRTLSDRLSACSLTDEEKRNILDIAEDEVAKEQHKKDKEAFMQLALKNARGRRDVTFTDEDVLLDLPGHALDIVLDGCAYRHGKTYTVPRVVADQLREAMQRAWDHEDEVGGANRSFYDQPSGRSRGRGLTLTRAHSQMSAKQILGGR